MKYGSFIKKMAEDFGKGWENIYTIHIKDAQHILSIHKYDQASERSKEMIMTKIAHPQRMIDCSATGNVPDIVEMSFTQTEG